MTKYRKEAVPQLKKLLGLKNDLAAPKIVKVVVNTGVGRSLKEPKALELIEKALATITGQKPAPTQARQSIASFKIRKGMTVGYKVTLRGKRMYDFLDRLIQIVLPRIRDFRGLDLEAVDESGNLTIGIREQAAFPEVGSELLKYNFGLEVTIVANAKNKEEALALYRALGFPLKTG